jgi:hypothetical protein
MRRSTTEDAERLADFHALVQVDPGQAPPNMNIHAWMMDLMDGSHPTFDPGDFLLVEDTATGEIASSTCLISQVWTYGGVPIKVGQPELVSTREEYRRRGLVREQFRVLHEWSAARGELMQAITGIPWYYRQFGYEMALPMGGSRLGFTPQVPRLPVGVEDPYRLRPATQADIPLMVQVHVRESGRNLVAAPRDAAFWRYELDGRRPKSLLRNELRVIETAAGAPVGVMAHKPELWGPGLVCSFYELLPGVSWAAVTPSVVRYLARTGEEYAMRDGGAWGAFSFNLGTQHPAYDAIADRLPRQRRPYAWYVRVPDLASFVRLIAPALEARLVGTTVDGHTGDLTLNFYRSGLRLKFEQGRLNAVEEWRNTQVEDGSASFPELTFLHLLFGRMSLEELEEAFVDCMARTDEARALLNSLFPKRVSNVWPVA